MTTNSSLPRLAPRDLGPARPRKPYKAAYVTAYRAAFIEVAAYAVAGLRIADPEAAQFVLPSDADDAMLGRAAREALEASRFYQPGAPDWDDRLRLTDPERLRAHYEPLMRRAKVRSRRQLFNDARHVGLVLRDGLVTITPWRHLKDDRFTGLPGAEDVVVPATAPDDALGAAVREGLALAR